MKTHLVALSLLALAACGDSSFTSADVVDGAPGRADVETPDTSSDSGQGSTDALVDQQPSVLEDASADAFDASDEKPDAGPFCFVCIPGGASGGAGYQLCAPQCVVCAGQMVCRPGVDP